MDNVSAAKQLINCLDLTSLSDKDTQYSIADLCRRAQTPYGNTAAVCVYSRFAAHAKTELAGTGIKTATVVNFPHGTHSAKKIYSELEQALSAGADEIDAVFPYKEFLAGNYNACAVILKTVINACRGKTTKIILETGELKAAARIREATLMTALAGADFIKTSTGKTKISATHEAANIILETIKEEKFSCGFKASGGIKTVFDAKQYLILAQTIMGASWPDAAKFRIGASSLLDDILKTINQGY